MTAASTSRLLLASLGLALGCGSGLAEDGLMKRDALSALEEVGAFGSNPGNLRMQRYVPARVQQPAPLVVALHGCTQTASEFQASGWSTFAEARGFYVVYPEQRP